MDYEESSGNPWASFCVEAKPQRRGSSKIINNRFPNNFKKTSSIVTCNICQVLIMKSQTLHHFKTVHNKKLTKKCSKYIIPYNAIEVYDLICEHKIQTLKKSNNCNKKNHIIQLKRKKIENNIKETKKIVPKLIKPLLNVNKLTPLNGLLKIDSIKNENLVDKIVSQNSIQINIEDTKNIENQQPNLDIIKQECKATNQNLNIKDELANPMKSNELKLNIKVNSNGILMSSLKVESNIFDRISSLCDNSLNKKSVVQSTNAFKGPIKQISIDKSYGCTVFTDEHNNSILIDNDKDEPDDFDCCESSVSNDSAYYSLPNTTTVNSLTTPFVRKTSNFYDSSIVPPLVTAYQFSSSANNTISYNYNGNSSNNIHSINNNNIVEPQKRLKTNSSGVVMTRNAIKNTSLCTKSNVKHRFYVSSHSNQNILNSIRKTTSSNKPFADGLLKESMDFNCDLHNKRPIHNVVRTDNIDFITYNNNSLCGLNGEMNLSGLSSNDDRELSNNPLNTCDSRVFIGQSLLNNKYWKCIHEKGVKGNLLVPHTLSWNYLKHRCKTIPHLYNKKQKYSCDVMDHPSQFNSNSSHSNISDNPLLTSYTIDSNGSDSYTQSDLINTSGIMVDYPFPDRNQMSFQRRLLERGVISQRDIARSQRCLSLNNHTLIRKNIKSNSNKPTFLECRRMLSNKPNSLKSPIMSHNGNDISGSQCVINKTKYSYLDPTGQDNPNNMSTILLDSKYDSISNSVLNNQRHSWQDNHKLPRIPNVNTNISTFQGLCLSQNNKTTKSNGGSIVIGSNSNFNTILSHLDNKSDHLIPNYKFQSDPSVTQMNNNNNNNPNNNNNNNNNSSLTAQNMFSNDGICFSQPLSRKYLNHSMNNTINRYNGYTSNFANHSTNVIHSNFDR